MLAQERLRAGGPWALSKTPPRGRWGWSRVTSSMGPRPGGRPPLTHMQAGRKLEDGGHWGCEPARGQAQARPPQEGALGRGLEG